jgi:hypothetical protein
VGRRELGLRRELEEERRARAVVSPQAMRDHAPRHDNAASGGPKRRDSHARVRSRGVEEEYLAVLEEFGDEQLTMTVNVMCVDHIIDGVPRDPSSHAAAASMRERLDDMCDLRGALNGMYLLATDPRMRDLLGRDAPLTEYLRGLYAWAKAVLRAFEVSGYALRSLSVDWAGLRARIEDAAPFYFAELESEIADAAARMQLVMPETNHPADPLSELDDRLADVFAAATKLSTSLQERFG